MTAPAPAPRKAGRPKVAEDLERLWLRVSAESKRKATEQAAADGHPDLTTAIRELVNAYGEGRVRITRRAAK